VPVRVQLGIAGVERCVDNLGEREITGVVAGELMTKRPDPFDERLGVPTDDVQVEKVR